MCIFLPVPVKTWWGDNQHPSVHPDGPQPVSPYDGAPDAVHINWWAQYGWQGSEDPETGSLCPSNAILSGHQSESVFCGGHTGFIGGQLCAVCEMDRDALIFIFELSIWGQLLIGLVIWTFIAVVFHHFPKLFVFVASWFTGSCAQKKKKRKSTENVMHMNWWHALAVMTLMLSCPVHSFVLGKKLRETC